MRLSPSYTDVNNAVASASNGDTVNVPAGSATWSSTLNVGTKAISIIGAGSGSTIITDAIAGGTTAIISVSANNTMFRLSGFQIITPLGGKGYRIQIAGPSVVRIDHCKIVGGYNYINANFIARGTGRVTGVTDHNEFLDCGPCVFVTDVRVGDSTWGQTAWSEATHPGTGDMLYFEDNTVHFTSAFQNQNADAASIYGHDGGRIVVRYNRFGTSSADAFKQDWIDAHGDGLPTAYGTVFSEVYNNTFYREHRGHLAEVCTPIYVAVRLFIMTTLSSEEAVTILLRLQ